MLRFQNEALIHDPIHGYVPFVSGAPAGESCERDLIDHAWVQRLRQIHQLQTAWMVYPSAEHSRFQHVLGVMHLAGRVARALYPSLKEVCPEAPGPVAVEALMRVAGLLHDVGHGPFGHQFDSDFLKHHGQTHETVGARIIETELGDLIRGLRATPQGRMNEQERLDPADVCRLIQRPRPGDADGPRWLQLLRTLFCGLYTVDNMDFVLRDAYMSGFAARAFDLDRLLHYSFFTAEGLTIHERGMPALVRFASVRGELFRSVYFHRTVRALDLELRDLFATDRELIFPGDPTERLAEYQGLTEWSLLLDVSRWSQSDDPRRREAAGQWSEFLARRVRWRMVAERNVVFNTARAEATSVFSEAETFLAALRKHLPAGVREVELRADVARHMFRRPETPGAAEGRNFLYDPLLDRVRPLDEHELYRQLPASFRLCRVYARDLTHQRAIAGALDQLLGTGQDDPTNM